MIISGLFGLGATVAAHAQTGLGVPMRQEVKLAPDTGLGRT